MDQKKERILISMSDIQNSLPWNFSFPGAGDKKLFTTAAGLYPESGLLALPANIRQAWKWLSEAKTPRK
jgi:hypothetical protein